MKRLATLLSVFAALETVIIVSPAGAQNAVPILINYQGEVRSPGTGEPIADGSYNMVFRVYEAESGSVPLWEGIHTTLNGGPVEVRNGIFSVILGTGGGLPLDISLFNNADRWLEIQVGTDILSPRQRITSVAYSMASENSRLLDGKEASEFADSDHAHSGSDITSGIVSERWTDPALARDGEMDSAIAAHAAISHAHHSKTTRFTELTGVASESQIPEAVARDAEIMPTVLGNDGTGSGLDADTVDGMEGTELEESSEIDADIGAHAAISDSHHAKTTSFTDLTDRASDSQIPDDITRDKEMNEAVETISKDLSAHVTAPSAHHEKTTSFRDLTDLADDRQIPDSIARDSEIMPTVLASDGRGSTLDADLLDGVDSDAFSRSAHTHDGRYWKLTGNSVSTTDFLGTTNNRSLEIRVDNSRALLVMPDSTSPNLVGGFSDNEVTQGVHGATIGGGGEVSYVNRVTDDYGTVGGGYGNRAGDATGTTSDAQYATAGGGSNNTASGSAATVAGGVSNTASGPQAAVGGGRVNIASSEGATVSGGAQGTSRASYATIGGGNLNDVTDEYGTVCGGENNRAGDDAGTTADRPYASVGGGHANGAGGEAATIGGGSFNHASALCTVVGGGTGNEAEASYATVGGGYDNTASGQWSTVPGGDQNAAEGHYSFAAGRRAKAEHQGAFVWGDSTNASVSSTANNQFIVRASGGIWLGTTSSPVIPSDRFIQTSVGAYLSTGGMWTNFSDRDAKMDFESVDTREVLNRLAEIPITTWNYKTQDKSVRHMGPMAQDFYAAFALGEDERHIGTIDADGVALAAIQELHKIVLEKNARISILEKKNGELEERLATLEVLVRALADKSEGQR